MKITTEVPVVNIAGKRFGDQESWRDYRCVMQPVTEFDDGLVFEGFEQGRSRLTWVFRRIAAGTRVTFFQSQFERLIPHMHAGIVRGRFTFLQHGSNYSCALLPLESVSV